MVAAILQFVDFKGNGFFRLSYSFFGNGIYFIPCLLVSDYFFFKDGSDFRFVPKPVVDCRLNFFYDGGTDFHVSEFVFRLACEHRIVYPYLECDKKSACYVAFLETFFEKIVHTF